MAQRKPLALVIVGLALFAMFFGAGNLIFPVMMGATAGSNAIPATIGFMITGVLLPVLAMIAAATSENGINGIANRIGRIPGFIFALMAFLSTGMMYAIPRVAAVSYSMSLEPHLKEAGQTGLLIYTFLFFILAAAMTINPGKLLDKIGTWLTPALLVLLAVLIINAFTRLNTPTDAAISPEWQNLPVLAGLQQGYGTLDAIASFVFGIIIITSLKQRGFKPGKELFKGTMLAGLCAGVLLALVYFGLSIVGTKVADKGIEDGGQGLAIAATLLFGQSGQMIFGAIVVLACLTTAVGLIGASTEFFLTIFTKCPRNIMILIHVLISMLIANLGVASLIKIAIPIMMFCYPITIAMTIVCLIDIFIPGHMYWTYRGAVWTAGFFGIFDAINQFLTLIHGSAEAAATAAPAFYKFMSIIPLSGVNMGWLIPCVILGAIGMIVDGRQGRLSTAMIYPDDPVGLIFQKGLTSVAHDRAKQAQVAQEAKAQESAVSTH